MAGRSAVSPRVLWTVAAVVVLVLSVLVWLVTRGPSSKVLVVGDSVTFMSAGAIDAAFGDDVGIEPVAEPGYTSTDLLPLVERAIEGEDTGDRTAVFLVGYNDVAQGRTGSPELERMVEISARFRCAVWLTLPTEGGAFPLGFDNETARAFNDTVRALVEPHPNVHVVEEWSEGMDAAIGPDHPTTDGIHPDSTGQRLLGEAMAASVERSCPDGR